MVWKQNFFFSTNEKIERNIEKLVNHLNAKKNEMNEQFEIPDSILVKYIYDDINQLENKFKDIFKKRKLEIENIDNMLNQFENDRLNTTENYIGKLKKDLNEIGYILDYEVEELIKEKILELKKIYDEKKSHLKEFFLDLEKKEKTLKKRRFGRWWIIFSQRRYN